MRINYLIKTSPVRLIDSESNQVGVVDIEVALDMAKEVGLDLVEIAPNSSPPVCRIMDFGKFKYQQKQKVKQSHKKQHNVVVKEIRLRPKIDKHDLDTKLGHARKFIEKGNRVQFTMLFRGREMLHVDQGREIMTQIAESMDAIAKVDRNPNIMGRRMIMVVIPK